MHSMMERGKRSQRLGAAGIVVRLGDGPTITVTREDDGVVLLVAPAVAGDWDRLWAVLESFGASS